MEYDKPEWFYETIEIIFIIPFEDLLVFFIVSSYVLFFLFFPDFGSHSVPVVLKNEKK